MSRWILLLITVAACGPTPARVPAPEGAMVLPDDLAGCYELQRTKRLYYTSPRLRLNVDTIPRMLRFFARDSIPAWTLTRLDGEGRPLRERREYAPLFWGRAPGSDSIRIMIHTGYSGSRLMLHAATPAGTLHGRATEHWDFGPPYSNDGGPVTLIRIPCIAATDSM